MTSSDKFSDRFKQAKKEEDDRKQAQRSGALGKEQQAYRQMIDATPPHLKIVSFVFWIIIILLIGWLVF